MKSLEESEQLLGELSVMCRQKQAKVSGFSEAPPLTPSKFKILHIFILFYLFSSL